MNLLCSVALPFKKTSEWKSERALVLYYARVYISNIVHVRIQAKPEYSQILVKLQI